MTVFLLFFSYLLGLMLLATLAVPPIYPAVFAPLGLEPDSSLYRFAMLAALLGLPWFLRLLRLDSWQAAGYTLPRAEAWAALGKGLVIGLAIMIVLNGLQWTMGIHVFSPPADKWSALYVLRYLLAGLVSGLAVGFIEETFFRGLMHTGMRRHLGFWATASLTALFYAAVHFMKPGSLGSGPFDSGEALRMVWEGISRVAEIGPVFDSFVTLFVVGVFLSMVRERTGNVLWAIGIHAGWVAVIKLYKYLTDTVKIDGQASVWVGDYDQITGWMATLWLAAIAAVYWWRTRPAAPK
jgi:membrane protease YdiL (CAAX protease family)